MISMEAKSCKENLSVAWNDYQKAFDRVPHQWLQDMLKAIKAPKEVYKLIKQVIPKWRTTSRWARGKIQSVSRSHFKEGSSKGTPSRRYCSAWQLHH